jgi:hypothetical protein
MLRCGDGATTEVLVILIEPLPPRTHPKVTVVAGAKTTEFTGSVATPGALVASALVEDAWQSIPELAVAIAANHRSLHGVIPLADIRTAMQTLQSNCVQRQLMAANQSFCRHGTPSIVWQGSRRALHPMGRCFVRC